SLFSVTEFHGPAGLARFVDPLDDGDDASSIDAGYRWWTFVSNRADYVAQLVGVKIGQTTGTKVDRVRFGDRLLRRVGNSPDIVATHVPWAARYAPLCVLDLPAVKAHRGARFADQRDAVDPPLGVHRYRALEDAQCA